jgi:hypothetical protein
MPSLEFSFYNATAQKRRERFPTGEREEKAYYIVFSVFSTLPAHPRGCQKCTWMMLSCLSTSMGFKQSK